MYLQQRQSSDKRLGCSLRQSLGFLSTRFPLQNQSGWFSRGKQNEAEFFLNRINDKRIDNLKSAFRALFSAQKSSYQCDYISASEVGNSELDSLSCLTKKQSPRLSHTSLIFLLQMNQFTMRFQRSFLTRQSTFASTFFIDSSTSLNKSLEKFGGSSFQELSKKWWQHQSHTF